MASTAKIRNFAAAGALGLAGLGGAFSLGQHQAPEPARIGGTNVPALGCEEDEVIGFDQTQSGPRPLSCIQVDNLAALLGQDTASNFRDEDGNTVKVYGAFEVCYQHSGTTWFASTCGDPVQTTVRDTDGTCYLLPDGPNTEPANWQDIDCTGSETPVQ